MRVDFYHSKGAFAIRLHESDPSSCLEPLRHRAGAVVTASQAYVPLKPMESWRTIVDEVERAGGVLRAVTLVDDPKNVPDLDCGARLR